MRREPGIIAVLALVVASPLASANRRSSAKSRREEAPAPLSWRFSKEQRERPTGLNPSQELVVKNPVPFTLYSGPRGASRDTKVKAFKQGKAWVATLRPPVGSRWMTFR